MHLLYLDDAGSAANANERYLVLGGVAIYEAQIDWFNRELDYQAAKIDPAAPESVEFHASVCFSGNTAPWNKLKKEERKEVIRQVLSVVPKAYDSCNAFACAVRKATYPGIDPVELAFEDLCKRFDMYLESVSTPDRRERGLIILDESAYESSLQTLARKFRKLGTQWGGIRNIADIPLFVDSKASRLIQLADHVAYATFRRYESADTSYFDIIASRFHEIDGVLHGLAHKQQPMDPACMCPACLTRRLRPVA